MAGSVALAVAHAGGSVAWVVPTYRNARPLWRFVEQHASGIADLRRAEMTAQFKRGHLTIFTAENDTGIRGEAFDLVICDEAAQYKPETWTDVIMPTLADRNGRAMLISTPKGKNWFWLEYMRGVNGERDYASFNAPSSANPSPAIKAAYEAAKSRVSERTFKQEWDAQFVDDGGGVFRYVRECATSAEAEPEAGRGYCIGVDWGRTNDATVYTVMDTQTRAVVKIDRMTGTDYATQRNRLISLAQRYNDAAIIAEANSMGQPNIEALVDAGVLIEAFVTDNRKKQIIIDQLALAFEQRSISILPDESLIMELQSYESKRTPTGLVSYSAPDGFHDDMVISLALALHGAQSGEVLAFGV